MIDSMFLLFLGSVEGPVLLWPMNEHYFKTSIDLLLIIDTQTHSRSGQAELKGFRGTLIIMTILC